MSTLVYQQPSSMDSSHLFESTTMKLKLVSPKSQNPKTPFESGWNNLLQSPSSHNSINACFETEKNSYVHNQKSLKLSEKSLQLCTESLGSETGSDTSEDVDAIFAFQVSTSSSKRSRRDRVETRNKVSTRSLPPPLTTKPFQVRSHREGGRLVIEAVEMSLGINGCLRVERSDGRLRLTCLKNDDDEDDDDYDYDYDYDYEDNCDTGNDENEMVEEEMERNNVVIENFQRLRRCHEDEKNGDKGMCCNWEPCCWVATS